MLLQEADQSITVAWTAFRAAKGVDLQDHVGNFRGLKVVAEHGQDLGVDLGVVDTDDFCPDLVELPVTAFLRTLVAEHRADIVEFRDRILGIHLVLNEGAHHWSCSFRTQGHRGAALVAESVHLLFNDVGRLAD